MISHPEELKQIPWGFTFFSADLYLSKYDTLNFLDYADKSAMELLLRTDISKESILSDSLESNLVNKEGMEVNIDYEKQIVWFDVRSEITVLHNRINHIWSIMDLVDTNLYVEPGLQVNDYDFKLIRIVLRTGHDYSSYTNIIFNDEHKHIVPQEAQRGQPLYYHYKISKDDIVSGFK